MKLLKSAALVPMSSFALAVLLGLLARTPDPAYAVRAAQQTTGQCTLSGDITAMAATSKNWNVNITVCDIATTNSRKADLNASSWVYFSFDVKGTDANGAKFEFNGLLTSARFTPNNFDRTHSPGSRTDKFAPQQCLKSALEGAARAATDDQLNRNGQGPARRSTPSFPAQTVSVITYCSYTCEDSTFKSWQRKLDMAIDNKGGGTQKFP